VKDPSRTNQKLIKENSLLRQRIQELEQAEADRKRTEEALRASEIRYQTIFETTGTIMLIVEEDMTISLANNRFESLTGYKREEIEGKRKWTEFIQKDDLEKMLTQHQLRRTGSGFAKRDYEFRLVHRDGRMRNIFLTVDLIPGTKRSVASLMDITDRKQAEEALLESEIKFKSFADQALAGVYLLQDGVFKYVNSRFAQMFGYTVKECLDNMRFENLVYAEDIANVQEQVRRRIAGEIEFIHYTFRGLKKNGQIFDVEIYGSASVHKGRPVAAGTLLDITERKQMEEALQESEEKYRFIAENTVDVISIVDMNLRFTYVSPSVFRTRGFTTEEAVKHTLDQVLTPESMQYALAVFAEEMALEATGTADHDRIRILELEEYKKDGSLVWVEVTMSYLRDMNGKPIGILQVSRDITERKRAEEEREKFIIELRDAMSKIKTLSGMLPICCTCKKIRDDKGYWNQIESYIKRHSEAEFSHSICPECAKKMYPDFYKKMYPEYDK
jgi:PAS domain S-box-containing protein